MGMHCAFSTLYRDCAAAAGRCSSTCSSASSTPGPATRRLVRWPAAEMVKKRRCGPVTWLGYDGSLRDLVGIRRALRGIRRCIERDQIDVVHSHLWPAARIAGLAVRGRAVRHLVQIQDTWPWLAACDTRSRFLRFFTRAALGGQQVRYVAVSQAAKDYSCTNLRIPPEHVTVIPNGVDLDQFGISGERPPASVPMADSLWERSPGLALRKATAGSSTRQRCWPAADWTLNCVWPATAACAPSVSGRRKHSVCASAWRFSVRCRTNRSPHSWPAIDLFVLPSEREGLPITLLEPWPSVFRRWHPPLPAFRGRLPRSEWAARAARRPGGAGGGHPHLSDDGLRQHFGQAAMSAVRSRFSMDAIARQIEYLYARLAAGEA